MIRIPKKLGCAWFCDVTACSSYQTSHLHDLPSSSRHLETRNAVLEKKSCHSYYWLSADINPHLVSTIFFIFVVLCAHLLILFVRITVDSFNSELVLWPPRNLYPLIQVNNHWYSVNSSTIFKLQHDLKVLNVCETLHILKTYPLLTNVLVRQSLRKILARY